MGGRLCCAERLLDPWHVAAALAAGAAGESPASSGALQGHRSIQGEVAKPLPRTLGEAATSFELDDGSLTMALDFLAASLSGQGLAAAAAVARRWHDATLHPLLWCGICMRGAAPLVRANVTGSCGFKGAETLRTDEVWRQLARTARSITVDGWAGELEPRSLLALLKCGGAHDFAAPSSAIVWMALTSTLDEVRPSLRRGCTSSVASCFVRCPSLFPYTGGFEVCFDGEDDAEEMIARGLRTESEVSVWISLTASPVVPVAICMYITSFALEGVLQLSWELKGDGTCAVRATADRGIGSEGEAMTKMTILLQAVASDCVTSGCDGGSLPAHPPSERAPRLHTLITVSHPAGGTDGKPGGSGWIPWTPKAPRIECL